MTSKNVLVALAAALVAAAFLPAPASANYQCFPHPVVDEGLNVYTFCTETTGSPRDPDRDPYYGPTCLAEGTCGFRYVETARNVHCYTTLCEYWAEGSINAYGYLESMEITCRFVADDVPVERTADNACAVSPSGYFPKPSWGTCTEHVEEIAFSARGRLSSSVYSGYWKLKWRVCAP